MREHRVQGSELAGVTVLRLRVPFIFAQLQHHIGFTLIYDLEALILNFGKK